MNFSASTTVKGQELARKLADQMIDNNLKFEFNVIDANEGHYQFTYCSDEVRFVDEVLRNNGWLANAS